jgi:geranylgeranyl pyrophosphate synthase
MQKNLKKYFKKKKVEIEKVIEKYFPRKINTEWLEFIFGKPKYAYSLKCAQYSLIDPVWNFLDRGGKRWRPILFLLVYKALGGREEKLIKDLLLIPEFIHQGTIIVDDVEDRGELRRGKACLHKIFGEDVAINVGNFLYFFPLLVLIRNKKKISEQKKKKIYELYVQEMINLHLGQGTDICWHRGKAKRITEKEYLQMAAYKTGCLTRMSAKIAAILARANEKTIEKVGKMAETIGIAFQIQDDILDITLAGKGRKKFGKSFGNDIKEGKRSLIVIYTLKEASQKDRKRLIEILDKKNKNFKEIREAISIIKKYNSIDRAKKTAQKLIKESWEEIDKILPESTSKKLLKEFCYFLIERKI